MIKLHEIAIKVIESNTSTAWNFEINDDYIKSVLESFDESDIDTLIYEYADGNPEKIDKTWEELDNISGVRDAIGFFEIPELYKFTKNWIKNEANEFNNIVKNEINGNKLAIYRAIMVIDGHKYIKNLNASDDELGIYWTYEPTAAQSYNARHNRMDSGDDSIVFWGEVNLPNVNWKDTVRLNIHPSLKEEKEIRLYKNASITLRKVYVNDDQVNISQLENKTFKA